MEELHSCEMFVVIYKTAWHFFSENHALYSHCCENQQIQNSNFLCVLYVNAESSFQETEVNHALAVSLLGECSRVGCSRPRARNPRTSAIHDYCSLRCSRAARLGTEDDGMFLCCPHFNAQTLGTVSFFSKSPSNYNRIMLILDSNEKWKSIG
jgi:hypothetical protein